MPINTAELMNVIAALADQNNLRVTVKESVKAGLLTGFTTIVGGLLLGPLGLAIGGTVGGVTSYVISKDSFRPVAHIILHEMTNAQREKLATSVMRVIHDLRVEDAALLLPLLVNNSTYQEAVIKTITEFIQSEMQMTIID